MHPLVSIIIPVYKAEKYIEKCVRSLFEQSFVDLEYIFVDDKGEDASIEIIKTITKLYPNRAKSVEIIYHKSNVGNAEARNTGLENAKGDYIIQVDSDDWVEIDFIEKLYLKAIETGADIVCCDCMEEYQNSRKEYKFAASVTKDEMIRKMPSNLLYSSVWNKLINKKLYKENNIRCFEGLNNWVDIGLIIRLTYLSNFVAIVNECLYHYNRMNENSVSMKPTIRRINDMISCSLAIEKFFVQHTVEKEYALTLSYLKYLSKDRLLYDPNVRDISRWNSLFPETHAQIWTFPELTIFKRITFSLAAKGFPKIATFLLDSKAKLTKNITF